uniref:Uncharacterized protein n=1 Tax=Arundo donax TaxID=35708 RepID=A0A0A9CBA7_ARUDO
MIITAVAMLELPMNVYYTVNSCLYCMVTIWRHEKYQRFY